MKLILIFTVLFLSSAVYAQQSQIFHVQVNNSAVFIDQTLRVCTSPQIVIDVKKHAFSFGPAIVIASEIAVSNKDYPKLVGFQGLYKYYPNGKDNKLNLFVYNETNLMRIVDKWTSSIWNSDSGGYEPYKYSNTELLAQTIVGYGIEVKLFKNFALHQGVGLGTYYSTTDGKKITPDAPELSDANINGYEDFGFSYGLNFGIKYTL